jgi:hypothetical protein
MVTTEIEVDQRDVDRLSRTIDRASEALGKSTREAVQWGGVLFAQSMSPRTKISDKKRKVVEMPIQRITTSGRADRRYARFGMKYWKAGVELVRPLGGVGKGAYKRYKSRAEARRDRRTNIGRSGLAKKTWAWAARHMASGGTADIMRVQNVATIEWGGVRYVDSNVRITNRLRYIDKALIGGRGAIDSALTAASNKMEHLITQRLEEAVRA